MGQLRRALGGGSGARGGEPRWGRLTASRRNLISKNSARPSGSKPTSPTMPAASLSLTYFGMSMNGTDGDISAIMGAVRDATLRAVAGEGVRRA